MPSRATFGAEDRFVVEGELGRGGMGVVYRAHDRERHMQVALKTIEHADALALYQLKREFRALADVSHPNLVALYELDVRDRELYFTMELVDGEDFLAYLGVKRGRAARSPAGGQVRTSATTAAESTIELTLPTRALTPHEQKESGAASAARRSPHAPVDVARLRAVFAQLCTGVLALHDAGYLHRDIKPSNVLVTPAGRVVLLDFGIVSELRPGHFAEETPQAGTPPFMAPELLAESSPPSPASDWYSVGVMLYRAFMGGALPFPMGATGGLAPRLAAQRPDVPEDLDALCARLLDPDPTRRPGDAEMRAFVHATAVTRDLTLVARARELGRLEEALAATRARGALTVRLHGPSGMGKTALARRFCDDAVAQGALVLAGRCYERESVPYKAIDGVVDELSRYLVSLGEAEARALQPQGAADLVRMFPVLRRVDVFAELDGLEAPAPAVTGPLPVLAPVDPLEQQQRGFAALRELCAGIARDRPLVLFVDDAQWGDLDSARLLDALLRPPAPPPVLVLLSHRSEAGGPFLEALAALPGAGARTDEVIVDALDADSARELAGTLLVAAGLPEADVPAATEAVARESRGIPYFVHELVRFLAEDAGARRAALPRLDEVIGARVAQLNPAARRLLEVIAVAALPISQRVALEAAELDDGAALYRLRSARLVLAAGARADDPVETYHDRIRETVVANLGADERRARHGRVAARLEAAGGADPDVLAGHFRAAGEHERARGYALEAARLACASLAFERGAELYAEALALSDPQDPGRRDLELAYAEALAHAGRGQDAAPVFLEAAEHAPRELAVRWRITAADQLMRSGRVAEGIEVLHRLADTVGVRLPATSRRALFSLLARRARMRVSRLDWKGRPGATLTPDTELELSVYDAVADGLAFIDNLRGADFQVRCLFLALRSGSQLHIGLALAREVAYASVGGPRTRARVEALYKKVSELDAELQDPRVTGRRALGYAMARFFMGDFVGAAASLSAAEQLVKATMGARWEVGTSRYLNMVALRHLGRYDEVRHHFEVNLRDAIRRGDRYVETTLRRACNTIWLAADDPEEARRDLERATWSTPAQGFHVQDWYAVWAGSEIGLYLGDVKAAYAAFPACWAGLERSFHTRVQTIRAAALWTYGRLAHVAGDAARARWCTRRLLHEGVDYARCWGQLLAACSARTEDDRDAARVRLGEAIGLSERAGLGLCEASARRRLGELSGGAEGATLVARADEAMRRVGIIDPERFTRLYLPGLASW